MSVSTVHDDVNAQRYEPDAEMEQSVAKRARTSREEQSDSNDKRSKLRRQIEHYFSDHNLEQDSFFHGKISEEPDGWLSAAWLLGCPKVEEMGVVDEVDIEAAIADSPLLEIRRLPGTEDVPQESRLQVRRAGGKALPSLFGGQPAGWLAAKVAEHRRIANARGRETGPGASKPETPPLQAGPLTPGAMVRARSGEYEGLSAKVLSVDGEDVTVLVEGEDVVAVASDELELA